MIVKTVEEVLGSSPSEWCSAAFSFPVRSGCYRG